MQRPIFIVEDDEDIRESLREVLEEEGHVVLTACHGGEALEHLRHGTLPCLIVLDLMMPVMDGFQLRDALRQDPQLAAVPVLVMTAGKTAPPADVVGVVRKPMIMDAVLDVVRRLRDSGPDLAARGRATAPAERAGVADGAGMGGRADHRPRRAAVGE